METILTKETLMPNISLYTNKNNNWYNYIKLHHGPDINPNTDNHTLLSYSAWYQIFHTLIPDGFNYVFNYPDQDESKAISLLKKYVIHTTNSEYFNNFNNMLVATQIGFNIYSLLAKDLNIPNIPHYKVDFIGLYGAPIEVSEINSSKISQDFQNMERPIIKVYNHRCLMKINIKYIQYFSFLLKRGDINLFWAWLIKLYNNQPRNERLDNPSRPDNPPQGIETGSSLNYSSEDSEIQTTLKTQYKTGIYSEGITGTMLAKLIYKTNLTDKVLLEIYNIVLEKSKALPIINEDPIEIIPKTISSQTTPSDIPDENDPNWTKLEFGQWVWSNGIIKREYVTSPDGDIEFFRETTI